MFDQEANYQQKWLIFSPVGLILTGMGTAVAAHASARKANQQSWFWLGTLGLCLLNAGISVFGEAIKSRVLHELNQP